jgi:hypothetical protein
MAAWRILPLARTRRLAIVGSATRKARAISAVVRPATVRSVSATRASSESAGVTTGEGQPQAVVLHGAVVAVVVRFVGMPKHRRLPQLGGLGRAAAQPVPRTVARRRRQPGAGPARDASSRPALQRQRERVLRTLLSKVPVTVIRIRVATTRPHSWPNASATAASTSALTPPKTASPRWPRIWRRGARTPPRSPG